MAFCVLALSQMLRAFNQRSNTEPIWVRSEGMNPWLCVSFGVSAILMACILFIPVLQSIFHLTTLTWIQWLIVLGLSVLSMIQVEAVTVSYTHLDVYKRQGEESTIFFRGVARYERAYCTRTVSYTHLDVYKRQIQRNKTIAVTTHKPEMIAIWYCQLLYCPHPVLVLSEYLFIWESETTADSFHHWSVDVINRKQKKTFGENQQT